MQLLFPCDFIYRKLFVYIFLQLKWHIAILQFTESYWDLNLEFQMLVALRVITTSEWSRSELL